MRHCQKKIHNSSKNPWGLDTGPDTGIEEFFEFNAGTNRLCKRNDLLADGVDRTLDDCAFTAFEFF